MFLATWTGPKLPSFVCRVASTWHANITKHSVFDNFSYLDIYFSIFLCSTRFYEIIKTHHVWDVFGRRSCWRPAFLVFFNDEILEITLKPYFFNVFWRLAQELAPPRIGTKCVTTLCFVRWIAIRLLVNLRLILWPVLRKLYKTLGFLLFLEHRLRSKSY